MPKVSVIIPVYNVENYLQKCLDSVINQSLKDIEIICINDGSTDSSLNILKSYASQDNRIIIIDKPNEGVSVARNKGLEIAKGEYIVFVDSDDWLELNALELCYNKIKQDNSDMVVFNHAEIRNKEYKISKQLSKIPQICNFIDTCENFFYQPTSMWGKFVSKKLITHKFIKGIKKCEDSLYFWEICFKNPKISILDTPLYNYLQRDKSAMHDIALIKSCELFKAMDILFGKSEFKKMPQQIQIRILDRFAKSICYELRALSKVGKINERYNQYLINFQNLMSNYDKKQVSKLQYYPKMLKKWREIRNNNHLQILKTIFSITNNRNKTHKIITILGFKLKVSIKNHLKSWQKSLQKKQAKTTQDTYVLFDSLSDASIECIDAYSLFCYMKANNYKAYYIMLKDNRLYNNLKINNKLENIIALEKPIKQDEKAFKQALNHILIKTKAVITSFGESAGYNRFFKSNPYWQYVFIQHGQICLKQSVMNNKYIYPEKFDKFLISSENERNIFLNSGFKDDKFIKVGLPRWDLLTTSNKAKEKSILFMFTWRKLDQQKFEKSMYKKNLLSLLHNQQLLDYLKHNNIKLYFAPHHALKNNSDIDFDAINSNIEEIPSTKISEAIKNCSMLVTDFSSVVFDFMFQDKPVICYGLDLGDKILSRNEQKDLRLLQDKQETFPNIIFSEQDVINKIKYYVENNFNVEAENLNKYSKYFYTKENIRQKIAKALENL